MSLYHDLSLPDVTEHQLLAAHRQQPLLAHTVASIDPAESCRVSVRWLLDQQQSEPESEDASDSPAPPNQKQPSAPRSQSPAVQNLQLPGGITALTWHPIQPLLLIAHGPGTCMSSWKWGSEETAVRGITESTDQHGAVHSLGWTPSGHRLIVVSSSDSNNQELSVSIYRADLSSESSDRVKLTRLQQHSLTSWQRSGTGSPETINLLTIPLVLNTTEKVMVDTKFTTFLYGGPLVPSALIAVDDRGLLEQAANLHAPIAKVAFDSDSMSVLVLTSDLTVSQFHLEGDGQLAMERQIKISVNNRDPKCADMILVAPLSIAVIYGGQAVRILDLNSDESQDLVIPNTENTRLNCIQYSAGTDTLAVGTDSGHVQLWKQSQNEWLSVAKVNTGGSVDALIFGGNGSFHVARKKLSAKILVRSRMLAAYFENYVITQLGSNRFQCHVYQPNEDCRKLDHSHEKPIKKVSLSHNGYAAVWDQDFITVVRTSENLDSFDSLGKISYQSPLFAMGGQSLFTVSKSGSDLDVWSYQGVAKQKVQLGNDSICAIEQGSNHLLVCTLAATFFVIDISRREARILFGPVTCPQNVLGSTLKLNSDGTLISVCPPKSSHIHIVDPENGSTKMEWQPPTQSVVSHFWDFRDPRILVVVYKNNRQTNSVTVLLVNKVNSSLRQLNEISASPGKYLGCNIPFIYRMIVKEGDLSRTSVERFLLPEFSGIDIGNPHVVKGLIDFSDHLLSGNFDDALQIVKTFDAPAAWENFARKCVKTRNIDLAKFCLGMTGNALFVQTLRRYEKESNHVQSAVLALLFGDYEEAELILTSEGEYSKLVHLFEVLGQWDKALQIAQDHDQVNLRNVQYEHAKYLEELNDFKQAAELYESSKTAGYEIPRMLLSRPSDLSAYIQNSSDKKLKNWLAHYAESQGEYETARHYYEESGDIHSLVRNLCHMGQVSEAVRIAEESQDVSAAFFLARLEEENGNNKEAIDWYTKAHCYNHACRIAKDNNMDQELVHLAYIGPKELMIDIGNYFEENGFHEKAVNLYHKAGLTSKAVELCTRTQQDNMMEMITMDLHSITDPVILEQCSRFFVSRGDFEKAVSFLLKARKIDEAIKICNEKNIIISEEMAEKIAPFGDGIECDKEAMSRLAELCEAQRSYHLASKKFAQSGDRVRALKALFKSGDVEKIIFFANVSGSRQKELFVLTANYLSTLKWHENTEILKAIISFYTKGKSFDSLASFYESCAQFEIDEFSNYEKALGAYSEAIKCLQKVGDSGIRVSIIDKKINAINQFVGAKNMAHVSPNDAIAVCEELIAGRDNQAVRLADAFALLVEIHHRNGNKAKALEILRRMKASLPSTDLALYVEPSTLHALGVDTLRSTSHEPADQNDIEEEIFHQ